MSNETEKNTARALKLPGMASCLFLEETHQLDKLTPA